MLVRHKTFDFSVESCYSVSDPTTDNFYYFPVCVRVCVCLCTGEAVAFVRSRARAAQQSRADPASRSGQVGAGAVPPHLVWPAGC